MSDKLLFLIVPFLQFLLDATGNRIEMIILVLLSLIMALHFPVLFEADNSLLFSQIELA